MHAAGVSPGYSVFPNDSVMEPSHNLSTRHGGVPSVRARPLTEEKFDQCVHERQLVDSKAGSIADDEMDVQ
jgi:hypothetical protein